ncbi:MAG: prepilin peptidase [Myxococcales bacterium]|nr:prepilin peptidase [Myxococcales bacterium]
MSSVPLAVTVPVILLLMLWGALWGSFLNVVVYRVPAGLSIVRPRSRCPACLTPIASWHNIPVVSWVWLRGACASCTAPISVRYPAVEATAAVLALAVAMPWLASTWGGDSLQWRPLVALVGEQGFVFVWLAIALIDADRFEVYDAMSLPLPLLGLALAAVVGEERGVDWQASGIGALVGGAGFALVSWSYGRISGREGLGLGDAYILSGAGALLGVGALPAVIVAAAVQGLLFAAGLLLVGSRASVLGERGIASARHLALPFGPFLVVASVQWLLLHRGLAAVLPWAVD